MIKYYFLSALLLGGLANNAIAQENPHFSFSPVSEEVLTATTVPVSANLVSLGQVDQLVSISYSIFHNGVLIENVQDFGTVNYSIRLQGLTYHSEQLLTGSGDVTFSMSGRTASAFTMGILDSYCVNRNRPLNMEFRFAEPGEYKLIVDMYGCTNAGTSILTSFDANTSEGCDGENHVDKVDTECLGSALISSSELMFNVVRNPSLPTINYSSFASSFVEGEVVSLTGNIHSNGYTDPLCAMRYELTKDGVAVTDMTEIAELSIAVRQEGTLMFEMPITNGSGMLNIQAADIQMGAFSLGMLDNDCVQRNRPVTVEGLFNAIGDYVLTTQLVGCSNAAIQLPSSYFNTCTEEQENDFYAESCDFTEVLFTDVKAFSVLADDLNIQSIKQSTIKVYPTLVNSILTIEAQKVGELKIVNALGQVVLTQFMSLGVQKIDVSSINNGVYFVEMNNSVQRIVKR